MAKVGSWSTTAGSNNSTPPDGWPEGQAPSTVNDCAREMMAQIRTVFADSQFFDQGLNPIFTGINTFTLVGDQTSAVHAGRRLKLFDATIIYATVVTASFTALTTITITADNATALTSSLSSFALSILTRTHDAIPRNLSTSFSTATSGGLSATVSTTTTQTMVIGIQVGGGEMVRGDSIVFNVFSTETGSATAGGTDVKLYVGNNPDPNFPGTIIVERTVDSRSAAESIYYTGILNCLSAGASGLISGAIIAHRAPTSGAPANPPRAVEISTTLTALTVNTLSTLYFRFTHFQYTGTGITTTFHVANVVKNGPQS